MRDPFGHSNRNKIGITGFKSARDRLGTYQSSYPVESYTARFDHVWYGENNPIEKLEHTLKNQFGYAIQYEHKGGTEWVYDEESTILNQINDTIAGYNYHVYKVDTTGETLYTINDLVEELLKNERI